MPVRPASSWPTPPDGIPATMLTWAETVSGGSYATKVLARGTTVRLNDVQGDACAHVLIYNAEQPWERLNAADTVKVPWQAYLGAGHPLLSDLGRVLAVITSDSGGRHDALCGSGPVGRERFVLAGAKHGLEPRDLPPSVSFFQGVRVEGDGSVRFDGSTGPSNVELRCEMDVVMLVVNTAHPVDPRPDHTPTTLEIVAWLGEATTRHDALWTSSPELERAFENTEEYVKARGRLA
jgi:uncharacterized protein YcgI (DUF1989 family)